jgi:recombination protein RecR
LLRTALPLVELAENFAKFPGIGIKTAQRMAYQVMSMEDEDVRDLAESILNAKKTVRHCKTCYTFTEKEICSICLSAESGLRDNSVICVVESPKDISAFERTGEFDGVYHVLHGLISPLENVTPDQLKIRELLERIRDSEDTNPVKEIIMATNPTVEGDATAMYISGILKPIGVRVSRLAFGLPVGGILEQADEVTIFKALQNRNLM